MSKKIKLTEEQLMTVMKSRHMGGKVIKIKESDIRNVVNKMISEQSSGQDETNPLDSIKPSPKINPAPSQPSPVSTGGGQQYKPTTNENILRKKISIRTGLKRLMADIEELIIHSGINPETNNIVRDIAKVQDKFEGLFGEPATEEDGEES